MQIIHSNITFVLVMQLIYFVFLNLSNMFQKWSFYKNITKRKKNHLKKSSHNFGLIWNRWLEEVFNSFL